jgi:hydrogenase nickel incorporation protein HypA/HybF
MHELSIISSIAEIAADEVRKAGALQVELIVLEIGELAGIDWEALDFAWRSGTQDTVLSKAECQVLRIPGQAACNTCGATFHMQALYDSCPHCGDFDCAVTGGKELKIKSLTVS